MINKQKVVKFRSEFEKAVKQLEEQNVHISEWAWLQTAFDLVLNNNSTVNHLYAKINSRL